MYKLDSRSLRLVLSALEELHSDADPGTLPERAVNAAGRMISADWLTFDFFSDQVRYEDTAWSSDSRLLDSEVMKPFGEYLHQHPVVGLALSDPSGRALKISDVISQREFERTDLYNVFYRKMDVDRQMGLALLSEGDLTMTYAFARKQKDFSGQETAIISLAAPHFVNAIRNGFAFKRLSDALTARGSGVIAIDSRGRSTFASSHARTLLEKYFPNELPSSDSLPETLSNWLRVTTLAVRPLEYVRPTEPYRVKAADNSRLTVRLLDNRSNQEHLLLLEEQRAAGPEDFRPFGLTARECEVLYWITEGKTDSDIAILLDLSIRTVEKHVENIYRKLGVETRTAALSTALGMVH